MSRRYCDHLEGDCHDCDYVNWRDSLVPVAEATADARHPMPEGLADREAWAKRWDSTFHREMDRLIKGAFGIGHGEVLQ